MILGLDPSLSCFGFALADGVLGLDSLRFRHCGVWRTQPDAQVRQFDDTARRCRQLAASLEELFSRNLVEAIAVEAVAIPFGKTSLSTVSRLGRVRGLVDYCAARWRVPVHEFAAQSIKVAVCGDRSGTKDAVLSAMERKHPELAALWPRTAAAREGAADAAAAILAAHRGHP